MLALNTAADGDDVCYDKFLDGQTLFKQQRKFTETNLLNDNRYMINSYVCNINSDVETCSDQGRIDISADQTVIEVEFNSTCLVTSSEENGQTVYTTVFCWYKS